MLNHEADFGDGIENLTLDGDSVLESLADEIPDSNARPKS